ncbi:hypothetical protein V6259_18890 [Marinomonas sp. TI.3.20]|uniref:hypothetical protein n=1 Tax=Marinomonas sp. TI.3.20 TaxID=3121296 RepID=UPI00311E89F0
MSRSRSNAEILLKNADSRGLLGNVSVEQFSAYVLSQIPDGMTEKNLLELEETEIGTANTIESFLLQLVQGVLIQTSPFFIKTVLSGSRFDSNGCFGLCDGGLKEKLNSLVNVSNISQALLAPICSHFQSEPTAAKALTEKVQSCFLQSKFSVTPLMFALPDCQGLENSMHIIIPVIPNFPDDIAEYQEISARIIASQLGWLSGYIAKKTYVRIVCFQDPFLNEIGRTIKLDRHRFNVTLANFFMELASATISEAPNSYRLTVDHIKEVVPLSNEELGRIDTAVEAVSRGQAINDEEIQVIGEKYHEIAMSIENSIGNYALAMREAINNLRDHSPVNATELKIMIENIPEQIIDELYDKRLVIAMLVENYNLTISALVTQSTGALMLSLSELSRQAGDIFSPLLYLNQETSKYLSMEVQ